MKWFGLFLCVFLFQSSNDEWTLAYDKNDIKVYTRPTATKLKEIKTQAVQPYSIMQVLSIFTPQEALLEWMFKLEKAQKLPDSHLYYAIDFPWPLSDRDLVGKSTEYFNTDTSHVIFKMESDPYFIEKDKDYVRMEHVSGQWEFKKLTDSTTFVSNLLLADPNGIPLWLVNLFAIDGPVKTYEGMSEELNKRYSKL